MRPIQAIGIVAAVLVAAGAGLLSTASHVTWLVHTSAANTTYDVTSAAELGDVLYAGTNLGVFESSDNGRTWRPPTPDGGPQAVYAVATDAAGVLYAGGRTGLFKRQRDGAWSSVTPPGFTRRSVVAALAVDPSAPGLVYAAVAHLGVLRTDDAGRAWTLGTTGLPSLEVTALALDTAHPGKLYVATAGAGVAESTDRGNSWRAINDGLDHQTVRALALTPHGTVLYAGSVGGGIYRKRTGEDRWEPASNGLADRIVWALVVDPIDPTTIYAGVSGAGIYWSRSEGASWTRLTPSWRESIWALYIDPRDRRMLHVGTASGLLARGEVTALVHVAAAIGLDIDFRTVGD